ncbi:MAG: AMP-binding protein [Natronomonas sp.]
MSDEIAWRPSSEYLENSNVAQFIADYGYGDESDLVPQSEAELAEIWGDMTEDMGIVWREPYEEVVDTSNGVEFAEWFQGGELNAVETILDQWIERTPQRTMYAWEDEDGRQETLSYEEVADRADELAGALRAHGVERGDTVGVVFPMHPNGFVACLACLRIGGVFTQIFPGYGAEAIGHRLDDSNAELVICADGYTRGGTETDLLEKADGAFELASDVTDVVVYEHQGVETEIESATTHDWDEFITTGEPTAETAVLASDEPAFIAYSSGTTGEPKGTIHTHSSLLVMGCKETTTTCPKTTR